MSKELEQREEAVLANEVLLEKDKRIVELEKELLSLKARTLRVHEENEMFKAAPDIARKQAQLDYDLKLAKQFSESGAFPKLNPEQVYVIIKAGEEMGLAPIVSLNMLYILKGQVEPYGDKMLGYILSRGYKVEYKDEKPGEVTARIYNDLESYEETARASDQVLVKSEAMKFAPKNKLRFHAVRMISSFHVPHLFMGCSDLHTSAFNEWEETRENTQIEAPKETLTLLEGAITLDELNAVYEANKKEITKNVVLLSKYGELKKGFEV